VNFSTIRKFYVSGFMVLLCILIALIVATPINASLTKTVNSSINYTHDRDIVIPAGISIPLGVSSTFSGNITVTKPGGSTKSISFSDASGAYSTNIALDEVGTYNVSESYTVKVIGSSFLGN
jgi:hypothetical protein